VLFSLTVNQYKILAMTEFPDCETHAPSRVYFKPVSIAFGLRGSLVQVQQGGAVKDICREFGISDAIFYNWKAKYCGMRAGDTIKMRDLEKENMEVKKMFAEMSIEYQALKNLIEKKW
jgi:putative transposase